VLVLAPVAGPLVDRLPRVTDMIAADLTRMVLAAVLAAPIRPARLHRCPRPVLPRPVMAAHPRLGPARLRPRGRRPAGSLVPGDRRDPAVKAVTSRKMPFPQVAGSHSGFRRRTGFRKIVGRTGFEPVTSSVSGCRSGASGSATEPLTCWLTWLGPGDSPAFTPLVLAVLGPM